MMKSRWQILTDRCGIAWDCAQGDLHKDDVEMAGLLCADIVTYGTDENGLVLFHHPVYPTLRLRPNNTHASYQADIPNECIPKLFADGEAVIETLVRVEFDGILHVYTVDKKHNLRLMHRCFPSVDKRLSIEQVTVRNDGERPIHLSGKGGNREINQTMGPMGINVLEVKSTFETFTLAAGAVYTYTILFAGHLASEEIDECVPDEEYEKRMERVRELTSVLALETGDRVLDTMFSFAKLRAGESVYRTRYGLIHSPGGKAYYAATWCNDQVEYAGPYFAYTGDPVLIEASANAYRMYRPFMSSEYRPIPSSVIAEGLDYWNGAGDRGDAAMYLYGASRFVLTVGDRELAREFLPAIEWCAEYCNRKRNEQGVIESDTDELENRFPAGRANLCTSTLAYDGYRSAAILEEEFGNAEHAAEYRRRAEALEKAINDYFACKVHGFDTYRYYDGCEVLRSWICMPLCVGITEQADGTVRALTSDYLMRPEGFLTAEGNETIWDRSTLYGLRGIFATGKTDTAMKLLERYCRTRLLGERVPYAVEAYPEGGKRHLSGESALFCKVITEGMLNIRPEGLHSFSLQPQLPPELDRLYLSGITAHGATFDIRVTKDGYTVTRADGKVLAEAKTGEKAMVYADQL